MAFPLIDQIRQRAVDNPIAPALVSLSGCITYGELSDGVTKIANHFDDRKLPRGGKAFMNFANPDLRLVTMLAAVDYGLIPIFAQPEVVSEDFEFDFVIGSPDPFRPDVPSDVMINESVLAGRLADSRRREFPERADDDLSLVVETSGTTGRPKLIAVTHKAHKSFAARARPGRRMRPTDRLMSTIGGATRYGVATSELGLSQGAASVAAVRDTPANLRLLNIFNVTHLLTTPGFMERALDFMELNNVWCRTVEEISLTGAMFSPSLLKRIESRFDAQISVAYGTSEVGGIARGVITSESFAKGYVGEINPELKFMVTGDKGQPGRITLANDVERFTKYINKGRIVQYEQPFLEIPDLGYIDGSRMYLVGRSDEVYNHSGNVMAYGAIADEIARLADVKDVGIVSGASLGDDRDLIVAVVADQRLNLDDLSNRLLSKLGWGGAKRFLKFCQLDEIRRSESGKIDRAALVRAYQNSIAVRA